ncbi:MAG TPA: HAMP domain-containing sensor histidine kinase [Candidatus Eremiobacteraceae bacterium]|nr:HAMP domain-containing sensor histidine kinase [Candidatus Eremiobacteraceae bacterium]
MRFPRSLHGRLTLAYAAALFVALCVFAGVSAFFLIQQYQAALDARLRETATALGAIGLEVGPSLKFDSGDIAQIDHDVTPRVDAAIFRVDGSVVTTTSSGVPSGVRDAVVRTVSPTTVETLETGQGRVRLAVTKLVVDRRLIGSVAVWASTEPLDDFKRILFVVFIVAIPAVVAGAIFSAGYVTRRGLEPLRDIAALATRIEATDLSRRLKSASEQGELGSLSAAFNRMLERLQAAFERQRRFTADASHELRAPLSVIRAESDLALRRSREPAEYVRALEAIASESDRLEELIDDLLVVARAEGGPPQVEAAVDLAPLVSQAATRISLVGEARGVKVEPSVVPEAFVKGDPIALARVPLALLHNGVKYARVGGSVRVTLTRDNGAVRLVVEDDGPGFTPDGLRRATDRFWRDDLGRGRDGSGLGLSIVRAIVEQTGGAIVLSNAPGSGAQVSISFPAL